MVEFSEADSVPWHFISGGSRPSVTPDRRALSEAGAQNASLCPSGATQLTLTVGFPDLVSLSATSTDWMASYLDELPT
jgi:hypothetical protein